MTRRRSAAVRPPAAAAGSRAPTWLERALPVAGLVLLAVFVVRLALQAARGVFSSDECFHAYAARWLLEHRSLPVDFPVFYSGFYYYYHPMFHVLGALWSAAFGLAALHGLPVAIHAVLLALLVTGLLGTVPPRAGRWAALLCATSVTLSEYAVQLYVDALVALVMVLAVALVLRVRDGARARDTVALGVLTAVAMLTKFNGLFVPVLLAALIVWHAARGERRTARAYALACALGVALALPWYVRNQVLFGSAFYPAGAPDLDRALYALNRARFSLGPGEFLRALPALIGPWTGGTVLVALAAAAARRRLGLREGLLLGALAGMVATAFVPMAAWRHLTPMLAVLALCGAWGVHDLTGARRGVLLAIEAVLLAAAVHAVWTLPDLRADADLADELAQAYPHVTRLTPPRARILSLWTYDTAYYTGRAATWPNPWGQREHPTAMFFDTDADSLLAHLERARIDYLLVPSGPGVPVFDSANYPASFLRCLGVLVRRDPSRLVWTSPAVSLVRVAGHDAAPSPSPAAGGPEAR